MRLLMRASRRGSFGNFVVGTTRDVPDDLAEQFIRDGAADPAPDSGKAQPPPADEIVTEVVDPDVPPLSIEDVGLSERELELLRDAGIETVQQVHAVPDLTKVAGIGRVTAKRILDTIAAATVKDDVEADSAH